MATSPTSAASPEPTRELPRFRYALDPICWGCAVLYACNRFWWKPAFGDQHPFLMGQFNDLLFIPVMLPIFLWGLRRLGLREHDRVPSWREALLYGAWWAVIAELIGPFLLHHGVADWRDALVYTLGAIAALLYWHRPRSMQTAEA